MLRGVASDTHPDAERVQIELLRRATFTQRFQLALSLSDTAIHLARQAIRQAHPDFDDEAVGPEFVALHYGEALLMPASRAS
jgi:hypothetical protein